MNLSQEVNSVGLVLGSKVRTHHPTAILDWSLYLTGERRLLARAIQSRKSPLPGVGSTQKNQNWDNIDQATRVKIRALIPWNRCTRTEPRTLTLLGSLTNTIPLDRQDQFTPLAETTLLKVKWRGSEACWISVKDGILQKTWPVWRQCSVRRDWFRTLRASIETGRVKNPVPSPNPGPNKEGALIEETLRWTWARAASLA